jgi:hypothetical protein
MGRIADPQEATFGRGGAGGQHSAPASVVAMKNETEKNGRLITVVVRRRVKGGQEAEFEGAIRDFIGFALGSPGHLSHD